MQMREQHGMDFGNERKGELLARCKIVSDLAENLWPPLSRATDHDSVGARVLEYVLRLLGSGDVAVCHHRQARRPLDFADRVVLGSAREAAGAGATVQGQE